MAGHQDHRRARRNLCRGKARQICFRSIRIRYNYFIGSYSLANTPFGSSIKADQPWIGDSADKPMLINYDKAARAYAWGRAFHSEFNQLDEYCAVLRFMTWRRR
jgi:hypothetical protein